MFRWGRVHGPWPNRQRLTDDEERAEGVGFGNDDLTAPPRHSVQRFVDGSFIELSVGRTGSGQGLRRCEAVHRKGFCS